MWTKISDDFCWHPKALLAGNEACGAWIRLVAWSSYYLTDGRIPAAVALAIAGAQHVLDRLVDARVRAGGSGLLELAEDGAYVIHDFLQYNPSAEKVLELRAKRSEAGRAGGKRSGVARRASPQAPLPLPGGGVEALASANAKQTRTPLPLPKGEGSKTLSLRPVTPLPPPEARAPVAEPPRAPPDEPPPLRELRDDLGAPTGAIENRRPTPEQLQLRVPWQRPPWARVGPGLASTKTILDRMLATPLEAATG